MQRIEMIDENVGAVRESYSLNNAKFACVKQSILNKNRIIKGRVILSCGYLDTG